MALPMKMNFEKAIREKVDNLVEKKAIAAPLDR